MDINNNRYKVSRLTASVSREIAGRKAKLKELWTFMHLVMAYEYIFATS